MLTVATTTGLTVAKCIGVGICMGIGFWISKKITNKADEIFLLYDNKKLQQLSKEMGL